MEGKQQAQDQVKDEQESFIAACGRKAEKFIHKNVSKCIFTEDGTLRAEDEATRMISEFFTALAVEIGDHFGKHCSEPSAALGEFVREMSHQLTAAEFEKEHGAPVVHSIDLGNVPPGAIGDVVTGILKDIANKAKQG